MVARQCRLIFLLTTALASMGASHRTTNFVVTAPSAKVAEQVGTKAEHFRKELALQWLGQEIPDWSTPCPIRVSICQAGASGASSFAFDKGQVIEKTMHVEGTLERVLSSVVPHEVMHTILAHHFGRPLPRWFDEGAAVLAEDQIEQCRHDRMTRQILNAGHAIPLRRLFQLTDYPRDVMALYAEGHSVTNFLVEHGGPPTLLAFVAEGLRGDWDRAAQEYYRFPSVEVLEKVWLLSLKAPECHPDLARVIRSAGELIYDVADMPRKQEWYSLPGLVTHHLSICQRVNVRQLEFNRFAVAKVHQK